MRKILHLSLFILFLAGSFSCKKDYSTEQYIETPDTVKPDLSAKVNTGVTGFVTNENNEPIEGALVIAGSKNTLTDKYGYFSITNVSLSKIASFIKISKPGYFDGFRTFTSKEGKETFTRIELIPRKLIGSINSATGGSVTNADGFTVSIPANAVVKDGTAIAYSGAIHIAAHWIDPSEDVKMQPTMPGDLRGIDSTGYLKQLVTYGMAAVELTGDAGEKLQIAPDKKATLTFPIPSPLSSTAPANIALWYFDETNGLWQQEGKAIKSGNSFVGEVAHFTFWNCDYGLPLVNFTAQIIDEELQPLKNTLVNIAIKDIPNSGRYSYTDSSGFIHGMIPANNELRLNMLSSCSSIAYTKIFTTVNNDVDLGTIIANIEPVKSIITGTVVDCNNNPILDGFLQIYGNGYLNRTPIKNGNFSFTEMICANSTINYIAIDNSSGISSDYSSFTFTTGNNNIGKLSICPVVAEEFIEYNVNGGITARGTPLKGSTAIFNNGSSFETWINYIDSAINAFGTSFTFSGNLTSGAYPAISSGIVVNGPLGAYTTTQAFTVNITEYGSIGNYIAGNFECMAKKYDPVDLTDYSITCSFRVKRTQ